MGAFDAQVNSKNRLFFRTNPSRLRLNEEHRHEGDRNAGDNPHSSDQVGVIGETWVVNDRGSTNARTRGVLFNKSLEELSQSPRYSFPSVTLGPATNSPQWWREKITQITSRSLFPPGCKATQIKGGLQSADFRGELPSRSTGRSISPGTRGLHRSDAFPRAHAVLDPLATSYNVNNPTYGAYAQDNWTLGPRLTLNLGLR